jgi:hypothetical protein
VDEATPCRKIQNAKGFRDQEPELAGNRGTSTVVHQDQIGSDRFGKRDCCSFTLIQRRIGQFRDIKARIGMHVEPRRLMGGEGAYEWR